MNVSLLITSFQRGRVFENSLPAILRQLTNDDEIVIVNDGPLDNMEQVIKGISIPTTYIDTGNRHYRGGSIAKNIALKACGNELVIIHDPEIIELSPCINQLKERFDTIENKDKFITCGTAYTAVDKEHIGLREANFIAHSQAPFVAGVLRKNLMAVNGWDERFIYWGNDDNDIMHRLGMNGVQIDLDEGMTIFHQWHERAPREAMGDYNEPLLYDANKKMVTNQDNPNWGTL